MKKLKNQEIEPSSIGTGKLEPEIYTAGEIIQLLQSYGFIHEKYGGYALTPLGAKVLSKPVIRDEIIAWGHPNIRATHETTFEITKESEVTEKGDCIIGVKANKACIDLKPEIKKALKEGRRIFITLLVDDLSETIEAVGSPQLQLTNKTSIVVRKSDFIDDRTLAIMADKAAKDINRLIIEKMKNPEQKMKIILEII